jgi:hypothetical protein
LLIGAPLWSLYQTWQLRTDAVWYAKLWDRRDRRLRADAKAGKSSVVLDPMPKDLARLPNQDLAILPYVSDANDWENDAIARFYGFESVRYSRAEYWPREAFPDEYWTRLTDPAVVPLLIPPIPYPAFHRALRKIRSLL